MKDLIVVVAALFAVVAGANDGSSILAAGLRVPGLRPLVSVAILLVAIVVGPLFLFGTGVAATLAQRLVPVGSGASGDAIVLAAAVSAMLVVFASTRVGLPTSLTLALIGAIVGAGIGAGASVSGSTLIEIVVFGLLAPVLAAGLAFGMTRVALRAVGGSSVTRRTRRLHTVAFSLQCLAYSANGGQKMLAVFAIAVGALSGSLVGDPWWLVVVVAGFFAIGVMVGFRRISATLGKNIMVVHLRHALVAESCSFAVVMSAGLLGVPLTMSQSVAGALVGAGASEARSRVRWPEVIRMMGAWVVTLPASFGIAALIIGVMRWA
ncbi:MAG: inorganic phosphate transporter [Ferrimicrobium sp.]